MMTILNFLDVPNLMKRKRNDTFPPVGILPVLRKLAIDHQNDLGLVGNIIERWLTLHLAIDF